MTKINEKQLKEIFIELKKGNTTAIEKLYKNYNKLIYGIAYSILKQKEDSEDIVQNIFSKISQIDKNKLPINKEASWLYTLTKNESITFLRKKSNNIDIENIYEIEDTNNDINNIIDKVQFNKIICKLNEKEKQIISLKIISNLSFEEIGKLLNEPIGTIKWRYYKSINNLKIMLSNLVIFIITFIIGIKTLLNKKISNNQIKEEIKENSEINQTNNEKENLKTEISKDKENNRDEINNINQITKEETIIIESENKKEINYYGIGILSISAIFLIITIIFFIKYQLKLKKKPSK